VRGSSVASLECFIYLANVRASSSSLFEHDGGRYAVAIYGMVAEQESTPLSVYLDNYRLGDLGHVLDLQLNAAGGTYVADNARLCFDASVAWAQRNDSLLVFERAAVCF
jgi:hypothetical protein